MTAFSKNTYTFPLDIKRQTGVKLLGVNGDTANRFIVTLQNAGVNLDLTGLYVRAVFRRSDGVTVLQSESDSPANITKTTGGVVTIDVLNGSFRDGDNEMEIQVLDGDPDTGDVLITSAKMLFRVRKELNSDDATESSHEYTVLQQLIDGLGDMTVTVETLAAGSQATAGLTIGDDYSYQLDLGIPRGADGTDGAGVQSITHSNGVLTFTLTTGRAINVSIPDIVTLSQMGSAIAAAIENSGHYTKPAGGIPESDLTPSVQASLNKADSALQSIAAGSIGTTELANGAVTKDKIGAGQVSESKLESGAVSTEKIQDKAVTEDKLANGSVTTLKIANGAITTAKIANEAVGNEQLAIMSPRSVKANNTGSEASPQDVAFGDLTFVTPASSGAVGRAGFVPAPTYGDRENFLRGDGSWQAIANMVGASSSAAGAAGLVPAPASGDQTKFLCGDGTWKAAVSASRSDAFIATFGETTVEEIRTALTAKKAVGVKMENTPSSGVYGLVETAWLYSFETGTMPTYDAVNAFTFVCPTPWPGTVIWLTAEKTQNDETEWLEYTMAPDSAPTASSDNPVKSGGVYTSLATKQDKSDLVTSLSSSSTDEQYPSARCVYNAIIGAIEGGY